MRPKVCHGLFKLYLWIACCFSIFWAPICEAGPILDDPVPVHFIREHAGIIISVLLLLLVLILVLLVKSRRLHRALSEKNRILTRASQTITSYFDIVDKNILSISLDLEGNITYVSTCFLQRYHHLKHELMGQLYTVLFEEQNGTQLQSLKQSIVNTNDWEGELLMIGNSDGPVWAEVSLDIVLDEYDGDAPSGYTLIFNDITNQKLIRHLSETDALTGIYNRYRIDQVLEHELNRQKRYHLNLVVGMIDLDFFKPVNDTYGHLVGDEVLVKFVEVIKGNIRKVDIFGRWGGEEFIIIYPETTIDQAFLSSEKLRKAIMHTDFPEGVSLTASFGITPCMEEDTIDEIVNRADKALYQAKESGRNCTRIVE